MAVPVSHSGHGATASECTAGCVTCGCAVGRPQVEQSVQLGNVHNVKQWCMTDDRPHVSATHRQWALFRLQQRRRRWLRRLSRSPSLPCPHPRRHLRHRGPTGPLPLRVCAPVRRLGRGVAAGAQRERPISQLVKQQLEPAEHAREPVRVAGRRDRSAGPSSRRGGQKDAAHGGADGDGCPFAQRPHAPFVQFQLPALGDIEQLLLRCAV